MFGSSSGAYRSGIVRTRSAGVRARLNSAQPSERTIFSIRRALFAVAGALFPANPACHSLTSLSVILSRKKSPSAGNTWQSRISAYVLAVDGFTASVLDFIHDVA